MTLITRSIHNTSASSSITLMVPGFDPTATLVVAPSATVDLTTVMTADALHAMQAQLASLVATGEISVTATFPSAAALYSAAFSGAQNVGLDHRTAVAADFGPITLYTVTTPGMYLISNYIVNTTSGGGGDSVGQLVFNYPDSSGGNAIYANMPSGTNATLPGNTSATVWATAGAITYTLGSAVFAGGLRMEISATVTAL